MIIFQTHLSENKREVEWVKKLEPDCQHYTEVTNLKKKKFSIFGILNLSKSGLQEEWSTGVANHSCPLCPSYRWGGWGNSTQKNPNNWQYWGISLFQCLFKSLSWGWGAWHCSYNGLHASNLSKMQSTWIESGFSKFGETPIWFWPPTFLSSYM